MSTKLGGYMGKVMLLDLTTQRAEEYPWTDEQRELYIGGKIMGARILCDLFTGTEKPLSEENIIVISTGPFTGTGAPSSSRFNMSTLSPQTGFLTSTNCGGTFGYYLKRAGMDALILRGKCEEHTWIEIKNGQFIFHNADDLWGMRISECHEAIRGKLKRRGQFGCMCIGPAGENLVKYASVFSGERAAGRTGVGSVFGWKNVKAITVTGNKEVPIAHPEEARELRKSWFRYLRKHPLTGRQLPMMGTAALVTPMQARGMLASRNYAKGQNEDFDMVNGETLAEDYNIVNKGCLSCPIRCARSVLVNGHAVKGPELETLGLLGGGIENNDMQKILDWNFELDELGMDTISAASTLAWAMEACEKGLWDNGLAFGKTDNISQIWDDIAHRRGIGDELAEGSKRLSEKYGGKEFAIHAKGLELAAYEPRRAVGMGLGYAVANRGGCHLNGGYMVILEGLGLSIDRQTPHAKADGTMMFQDLMEMVSALGQCMFTAYAFFPGFLISQPNSPVTKVVNTAIPYLAPALRLINKFPEVAAIHIPVLFPATRYYELVTGAKMTFGKHMRCGERGYNLERYASTKFGVSSKDDALPKRLTDSPQIPGDPKTKVPLDKMKKSYYHARGWDKNGIPTKRTLR
ncbi:MAG: aldehyde ferredoxin oxidoreductase family protein [Mogibacterium sp.]|nr:aldehyde ferredoxin oxidoreductase family protein [Mogibacterium sp.]